MGRFIRNSLVTGAFAAGVLLPFGSRSEPAKAPTLIASAATITYFTTEGEAQAHCQRDVVVWLNIPSGIYHYKGERWYGRTKHGAFVCEKEAIAAGDRATENGQ